MRNIGIWIDKRKAFILTIQEDKEQFTTIVSGVEEYRIGGGSGTRFKGGPQDVVQDSRYLEREKHQLRAYFRSITSLITAADNIVIFGPAEIKEKFHKELISSNQKMELKVRDIIKADSMTENQTKALIRDYFKNSKKMAI